MIFYMKQYSKGNFTIDLSLCPCMILEVDNWNDFGYNTTFNCYILDEHAKATSLGRVKIYKRGEKNSSEHLETTFSKLDQEWCSLGQSIDYYEILLSSVGIKHAKNILTSLNDVMLNDNIKNSFMHDSGFQQSLLRWSETEKSLYEARKLFSIDGKDFQSSFTFTCQLSGANGSHTIQFDFAENNFLPFRINVLIGKNGTGKTQVLSKLANALSGYKVLEQGSFNGERPLFSKVISISYSAFDMFEKPHQNTDKNFDKEMDINKNEKAEYSYVYCGLQSSQGTYSLHEIKDNLTRALKQIKISGRVFQWRKILKQIIEPDYEYLLDEIEQEKIPDDLSSGQSILLSTMTEVIASIEKQSILLFDEPELHLHPNAISNLIRMLYTLLDEFDSYAIISTHSPLIIQETPSKYVNVIERIGKEPHVRKLDIESFGENLSNITTEVFCIRNSESNYKAYLEKMSKFKSYDDVINSFDNGLSLNALVFLKGLYHNMDGGK